MRAWSRRRWLDSYERCGRSILSTRPSMSVSTYGVTRTRVPDRARFGKVERRAGRVTSVGLEVRPATRRVRIRAATRRAGHDGGRDRAAAAHCSAPVRRRLSTQRSAWARARGARTGALITRMSSERNTSSKLVVNLLSLSRIRKRTRARAAVNRLNKGGLRAVRAGLRVSGRTMLSPGVVRCRVGGCVEVVGMPRSTLFGREAELDSLAS